MIILIFLVHAILFILCERGSISIWLNRDPLKYVYIEKEPLYCSLLSQSQCRKLVFKWIEYHSYHSLKNMNIPKVIKVLCLKYTFIDNISNIHNDWQLFHGRKLKKDKIESLQSISKLLFIEIITGIGIYICSLIYCLKLLFIQYKLSFYILFFCQICLYLLLILTLITFSMMPSFNKIFYDKLCCKFQILFEKQVLSYLESKYPKNNNYSNQNYNEYNDSYRVSKIIHISIPTNNCNDNFVDDTIITEGGVPSFIATSNIITELHLESKQKESTIDERHSLKFSS